MHVSFVFQNTCEHKWRLFGQPTTLKLSENIYGPTNKVQMSLPNKLEISLASLLRWLQLQQNGYAQRMGHTLISVVCRCLCKASRFLSTSFFFRSWKLSEETAMSPTMKRTPQMVTTQKKKAAPNKYIYKFIFLKNIFFPLLIKKCLAGPRFLSSHDNQKYFCLSIILF